MLSLYAENTRTDTSDGCTEMRQDWGTRVAHLTLDRELRLDINLSQHSPDRKRGNAREKENGREDDNGDEFREHAYTHGEHRVEVVRDRAVDCNRR